MIIKSNATIETDSVEIDALCIFMSALDLPSGAKLISVQKNPVYPDVNDPSIIVSPTYSLYFEWEVEV